MFYVTLTIHFEHLSIFLWSPAKYFPLKMLGIVGFILWTTENISDDKYIYIT